MSTDDRDDPTDPLYRQHWPMVPDRDPNREYGDHTPRRRLPIPDPSVLTAGRRINRRHPLRAMIGVAMLLFVVICIVTALGGQHADNNAGQAGAVASTATAAAKHATSTATKATAGQRQAIRASREYLTSMGFSRAGLITQLSSSAGSGFSHADAVYAVDHIKVNWDAQAVRSAREYLAAQSFSRTGLIAQLHSTAGSGYTLAQATYAVKTVGL
jgi:hypothetical protein